MSEYIKIDDIDKIDIAAETFLDKIGSNKVVAFNGKMGVGKTTFINALCKLMGVTQIVNSPTFSIVNEYETKDHQIIYHLDCYRINKIQEALDLGIEEYFYSGNYCFIEWSENISPILPDHIVNVSLTELQDGSRSIEIH